MTSPLYPIIAKFIEDEWVELERNQITPWAFLTAGPPFHCKDFYGKEIAYQGISFEGSPRNVFWGRYIEPFLEDIAERTIQETIRLAIEKGLNAIEPLNEVSGLLKSVASRAYDRMAVIDQRLLGKGFPENEPRREVDAEFASMEDFINQRITAELAMTKRKYWNNGFFNNQWVVGIGTGLILLLLGYLF